MNVVDCAAFMAARDALPPAILDGIPKEYEAHWIADSSPYEGRVDRLVFENEGEIAARICVLRPADGGDTLFCFYGRREDLNEEGRALFFQELKAWFRAEGIETIQGPLEFSTWYPYRFVCEQGNSPWFPGEQPMPDTLYADFVAGGFSDVARYASTLVEDLAQSIDVGLAMGVDKGLAVLQTRAVTGNDIVGMLPALYDLSVNIFRDNYAYSPIGYEQFEALYSRIAALDAAVIVAEDREGPVGMAFSYNIGPYAPSLNDTPELTCVLKTIGVHPRVRKQRIGFGVSYLTHKHWMEQGFQRIIHAYMKSDNVSRAMSSHFGQTLREYALVGWSETE